MPKREQIIKAAIKVFAEKGLERGKISDIAVAAGIGKGTVYEYFASKDELFAAIEDTFVNDMEMMINGIVNSGETPPRVIEQLMESSIDYIVQMDEMLLFTSEMFTQAARGLWHGKGISAFADMYEGYRQAIISVLKKGCESGDFREMNYGGIATLLMAFIDGLVWQYLMLKDRMNFDQIRKEAIRSFMKGIER